MKIKQNVEIIFFFLVLIPVLAGISCDSGTSVRKYKEKSPQPTAPNGQAKAKSVHFQWETPQGWNENRPDSGMRLATFTVKSGNKESICTIIPLQGKAGGLEANVTRWLEQIKTTMPPSDQTVETLLKSQEKFLTKGQFPAVLIDYTPVTPLPADQSILASVISVNGNSIFIKMMGQKSHLMENKTKFKALCQSFTITSTSKPK